MKKKLWCIASILAASATMVPVQTPMVYASETAPASPAAPSTKEQTQDKKLIEQKENGEIEVNVDDRQRKALKEIFMEFFDLAFEVLGKILDMILKLLNVFLKKD